MTEHDGFDEHGGRGGCDGREDASDPRLSSEQLSAVAALASTNTYAKQSAFTTLRELHGRQRWSFFVQHFLMRVALIVVGVIMVVTLLLAFVLKAPDPQVGVQGVNMEPYAEQIEQLEQGYLKASGEDPKLVDMGATMSITNDGTMGGGLDDSTKLTTMGNNGELNMLISSQSGTALLVRHGMVTPVSEVLDDARLAKVADALVDAEGKPTEDAGKAYGIDLDKSSVWSSIKGAPKDAIFMFSNVRGGTDGPLDFFDYLDFRE